MTNHVKFIEKREPGYFGHIARAQNLMTEVSQEILEGERCWEQQIMRLSDNIVKRRDRSRLVGKSCEV